MGSGHRDDEQLNADMAQHPNRQVHEGRFSGGGNPLLDPMPSYPGNPLHHDAPGGNPLLSAPPGVAPRQKGLAPLHPNSGPGGNPLIDKGERVKSSYRGAPF